MGDPNGNGTQRWIGKTEATLETLDARVEGLEGQVEKVYDRLRNLELRIALYTGGGVAVVWFIERFWLGKS